MLPKRDRPGKLPAELENQNEPDPGLNGRVFLFEDADERAARLEMLGAGDDADSEICE